MKSMNRAAALSLFVVLMAAGFLLFSNVKPNRIGAHESHYQQSITNLRDNKLAIANSEIDEAIRLAPDNAYYIACKGLIIERIAEKEGGGRLLAKFLNNRATISRIGTTKLITRTTTKTWKFARAKPMASAKQTRAIASRKLPPARSGFQLGSADIPVA